MRAVFLDIDGVLNGHEVWDTGYCGIDRARTSHLNKILWHVPDCMLVISSSWRYMILRGEMTVKGFEYLLIATGVDCYGRVHGYTGIDDCSVLPRPKSSDHDGLEVWGRKTRAEQIMAYAAEHDVTSYVVLDDLALEVPNFLQTDGMIGLTDEIATKAIAMLAA